MIVSQLPTRRMRLIEEPMTIGWGHITIKEILDPIAGALISGSPQTTLTGISTDSRTIREGELFWALVGDIYDGHDFAVKALEKGAAAMVVESQWLRSQAAGKGLDSHLSRLTDRAVISVADTLKALGDFAAWWRRRYALKVVGITGSSGKTTTKEMTAAILELGHRTLKNRGNFNNLIGLPLTLLQLGSEHACAVLEMGMNHPGEIARLTDIANPNVGVILNVGMAHLEGLSDLDGVARAKTEMMERISSRGLMILNGDDAPLMRRASLFSKPKMTFGLGYGNDVRATSIENEGPKGTRFLLEYRGSVWPVRIRIPGMHHLKNALAAAAVALSLDEPVEHIIKGLEKFTAIKGRFDLISLEGGILLVDDTYNANPSSLGAAIDSVGSLVERGGRIIVGLGEMLELGDAAIQAHREAGGKVAKGGASWFYAMGDHAQDMMEGAGAAGMPEDRLKVVRTHDDMVKEISQVMSRGDLILLKGSRRMQIEKVVEGLCGRARGENGTDEGHAG
jgi:UDP-N-acetylmuramoyl-tripeptide--D-alanyl-D-alanine ligase